MTIKAGIPGGPLRASAVTVMLALAAAVVPAVANAEPFYLENVTPYSTTAGANPNDPMYTGNPSLFYDGMANLLISTTAGTFRCSGSLIGMASVLTAAHCVDPASFGPSVTGLTGSTIRSGTFRHGQNEFDASVTTGGLIVPGTNSSAIFLYDFDDGTGACNSIFNAGVPSSLGLGLNEVMIAPGDSGGLRSSVARSPACTHSARISPCWTALGAA